MKEAVKMVGNASLSMELWSAFVLLGGQDQDAKKVGIYIRENIYIDSKYNCSHKSILKVLRGC